MTPNPAVETLEDRLAALGTGDHVVRLHCLGAERRALVHVTPSGRVEMLLRPQDGDIHAQWLRLNGNAWFGGRGGPRWGARDAEFMKSFEGPAVRIKFIAK